MRISDWSSDVCSSDLLRAPAVLDTPTPRPGASPRDVPLSAVFIEQGRRLAVPAPDPDAFRADPLAHRAAKLPGVQADTFRMHTPMSTERVLRAIGGLFAGSGYTTDPCPRSEAHTSELQSLMRISYAVFCLKKKK